MKVIGLTGSIGMGKSTTADLFRAEGVPVFDADHAVHQLYQNELVKPMEALFPGVTDSDGVDRAKLARLVTGQPEHLKKLEALVHPAIRAAELAFIETHRTAGADHVLLDVPLLFESGGDALCDVIVVVTAPADVQKARVLARSGMNAEKFKALLSRQMSDADKRAKADHLIFTDKGLDDAKRQVKALLAALKTI